MIEPIFYLRQIFTEFFFSVLGSIKRSLKKHKTGISTVQRLTRTDFHTEIFIANSPESINELRMGNSGPLIIRTGELRDDLLMADSEYLTGLSKKLRYSWLSAENC